MRIVIGLLAVVLTGCATTIAEFRSDYPAQTIGTVETGHYSEVAHCVIKAMEPDLANRTGLIDDIEDRQSFYIGYRTVPTGPFLFGPTPVVELLFVQSSPHVTTLKARHSSYAGAEQLVETAKRQLPACRAPVPDAGAPTTAAASK